MFEKIDERPGLATYAGRQVSLDRAVKILVIPEELTPEAKKQYVQIHRRIAQFNHPNLVRVIEVNERDGLAYCVTEDMGVPPISREIDEEGPMPWPDSLGLAAELATAMAQIHGQQIVHGDLSPNNVYVGEDGRPKIMFTGVPSVPGGPYTAPEREENDRPTAAGDVYSLGAVTYFIFTGRPPAVSEEGIENPRDLSYMPEELEKLLDAMMAEEAEERPRNAKEVLEALQALSRGAAPDVKEPLTGLFREAKAPIKSPGAARRGTPLWLYLVGGLVAAALVVAGAVVLAMRPKGPEGAPGGEEVEDAVQAGTAAGNGGLPDAGRRKRPGSEDVSGTEEDPGEETAEPAGAVETAGVEAAAPDEEEGVPSMTAQEISAAFEEAKAYAKANPEDLDGIISKFQTIARAAQNKRMVERCGEKVKFYREKLEEQTEAKVELAIEMAKALAAQGKIEEAAAQLAWEDESMLNPRQMAALRTALDIISEPLRKQAGTLEKQVEAALKEGNAVRARAALTRYKACGAMGSASKIDRWERLLTEMEDVRAQEAAEQKRKAAEGLKQEEQAIKEGQGALRALHDMETELQERIRKYEFEKAERLITDSLPYLGAGKPAGEAYAEVVRRLANRMSAAQARLLTIAKEGKRITLHKAGASWTGKVSGVTDTSVVLHLNSGPAMEIFFKDMDIGDFRRYSGMDTGVQEALIDDAGRFVLTGEAEAALQALNGAEWRDELKPLAEVLKQRAGRRLEREAEARELLLAARKAYYDGDAEKLQEPLNRLRHEYSDTEVYQENLER